MDVPGHASRISADMKQPLAVFRADASLAIGAGHVMRCLTLADALREAGWSIRFICREHRGNLIRLIEEKGFPVSVLPATATSFRDDAIVTHAHPAWLGAPWEVDAQQTISAIVDRRPDWLVVDHYGLGANWEQTLRPYYKHLMVIDDLADRPHVCAVLLNQNLNSPAASYDALVPRTCRLLVGTSYALLRPGFAILRSASIASRQDGKLEHIVISLGGMDSVNATSQVLAGLVDCPLPATCRISVVMGSAAPWLDQVREAAAKLPFQTAVLVNVTDMPGLLATADLAIGAAGSSSWERCVLGLPCLMLIVAENQRSAGLALQAAGAAELIDAETDLAEKLQLGIRKLIDSPQHLVAMAQKAAVVCDGEGVFRVVSSMREIAGEG